MGVLNSTINYLNIEDHTSVMTTILGLVKEADYLNETEVAVLLAHIEVNKVWLTTNLVNVGKWLDKNAKDAETTTVPTTSTSDSTTSESSTASTTDESSSQSPDTIPTTLGSSSLVASLAIIVACVVTRKLI